MSVKQAGQKEGVARSRLSADSSQSEPEVGKLGDKKEQRRKPEQELVACVRSSGLQR